MASETYPRIKFKKFHLGSYNAEDTDVNAVEQRLQSFTSFMPLELKQIKNSERIVNYAVNADFTTKHFWSRKPHSNGCQKACFSDTKNDLEKILLYNFLQVCKKVFVWPQRTNILKDMVGG